MTLRRGSPWGSAASEPPDLTISGTDADLADRVSALGDALIRFEPAAGSDLGAALGIRPAPTGTVLPLDALDLGDGRMAVNIVVLGTAPDRLRRWSASHPMTVTVDGRALGTVRATTVVVAVGQFLRGNDVSPRGHPGDGRVELQRYAVAPGERRALRARLRQGVHLPHPAIGVTSGREVEIVTDVPLALEIDGRAAGRSRTLHLAVRPNAYRLLV